MKYKKERCDMVLENLLAFCLDEIGYNRFSGAVYMAKELGFISDAEKREWMDKANQISYEAQVIK